MQKEAHIFDKAFDLYEKERVALSELGFMLKKIYPQYKPRRYGCKTLGEVYEKLDKYEVIQVEEKGACSIVYKKEK
ncbi:OST-HTH/LOTUS domain-containing protein [Dysgonomonas alginatilytica]|uniref:OST-HTH/LOTUS domain-containing protein n=1 Tax=Dysgonomonas alginatilytica TaxID=1605892 RepID=UPI0021D1F9A6|nr:OST-HTH/LOTUS domain-containing protein [Dysgonomonas alginatilytica]